MRPSYGPFLITALAYLAAVWFVDPFRPFPVNDDWVYLRDVIDTVRNGTLSFQGWETAWGIPQIWLAALFSPDLATAPATLKAFGVISLLIALGGLHHMLRRMDVGPAAATLFLLGVAFFPPLFLTSFSFMTDTPFLALLVVTLVLLEEGYHRYHPGLLAAGVALALLALSQRQAGLLLVAPLGLAGLLLLRRQRAVAWVSLAGALALGLAFWGISRWWEGMYPSYLFETLALGEWKLRLRGLHIILFFAGLALLPVALALGQVRLKWESRRVRIALFMILAIVAGLSLFRFSFDPHTPFAANLISVFGVFHEGVVLLGRRPMIFSLTFSVICLIASLAWLIPLFSRPVTGLEVLRGHLARHAYGTFTIGFTLCYLAAVLYRGTFFDRYLIPALPGLLLGFAVVIAGIRVRLLPGAVGALFLILFSSTLGRDYFAWNSAKWALADQQLEELKNPWLIDGGYEWNGWNGKGDKAHPSLAIHTAWRAVSFSPGLDGRTLASAPWHSYWPPHERQLYVVELPRGLRTERPPAKPLWAGSQQALKTTQAADQSHLFVPPTSQPR